MTAKTHLWIVAALVGIASAAAGAESAAVLLEKGIYQEETVGNLDAAAKIYRQIIDQARADRPTVAEAQLRLGMCLLKQGKRQAAGDALRRVVDRFADQQQIAARARKQLERLFPAAGGAGPAGGVRLSHVDDSAEGKWSLAGSGHAVAFQRGREADKVVAIRIYAARYGHAQAPDEDFHVYLLGADWKVIADLRYPYGLIERGDMRWYTLRAPGTPVPEHFHVALSFRPHRTKGVYLGYDKGVAESHSYRGLPEKGFEAVGEKYDWMVRVFLSAEGAPAVAATRPETFANDVPASLKEIAVTFDREMMDESWSWTMYGDGKTFPPKTGEPSYDRARRTCTLPVKLQPGKVYWVGVNSAYHHYFQTPSRIAARAHVILFATRSADGEPTAIPEDLLARAKAINSPPAAGGRPEPRPLKLLPPPWPDGEVARLDLTSQTGLALGTLIYTVESVEVDKTEAWRIESRMVIPLQNMWQFTRVDAKRRDMAPIAARTRNSILGDFRAEYGDGTVTWKLETPKKKDVRKVELAAPAFDNEQAIHLIRRLPLKEGYTAEFTIFPVQSGMVSRCRIEVAGKEKVKVPAGSFECFQVDLHAGFAGAGIDQQLWISAGARRHLVKVRAGHVNFELVEVGVKAAEKPAEFRHKELGLSLTAPAGWFFYNDPAPKMYKAAVYLLPPELKHWCILAAAPRVAAIPPTPREVARLDVEILPGYFKGYKVREKSWADVKVAGAPAVRYIADYRDEGRDMVEYRTYLMGKSLVYWFVFRVRKDEFEAARKQLDSIIDSLTLQPGRAASSQPKG